MRIWLLFVSTGLTLAGCSLPTKFEWKGSFHYKTSGISHIGQLAESEKAQTSSSKSEKIEIEFNAQVDVRQLSDTLFDLRFQSPNLHIAINDQFASDASTQASQALTKTVFYFRIGSDKRTDSLYAEVEPNPTALLIARNFLSQWRLNRPKAGLMEESEAGGRYTVRYEDHGPKTNRIWLSVKPDIQAFVPMPGRTVIAPDTQVQGQAELTFDDEHRLIGLKAHRTQESKFAKRSASSSEEDMDLALTVSPLVGETPFPPFSGLKQFPLTVRVSAEDSEAAMQKKELGSLTLQDIQKIVPDKSADNKVRVSVFLKFRALFYLHSEQCDIVVGRLSTLPIDSVEFILTSEALAGTGTPESQAALIKLSQNRQSDEAAQIQIFHLLSKLPNPTAEMQTFLQSAAFDSTRTPMERYNAQLVVGSLIRKVSESDPARGDQWFAQLEAKLTAATTEDDQLNLLYAIGNTAHKDASESVVKFLISKTPKLRGGAIHALRLTPSKKVDVLIQNLLKTEADPSVVAEANRVLKARNSARIGG